MICVKQRTTCMFCSGDGRHLEGESLGGQDVEEEIQGDFFCGICPGGTLAHSMLNIIFIGPESDHWQCLLLTHWLTNWLTDWLPFSKLDWCDSDLWRCQFKTCWGCYCCWWWGSCWQKFVADLEGEVLFSFFVEFQNRNVNFSISLKNEDIRQKYSLKQTFSSSLKK